MILFDTDSLTLFAHGQRQITDRAAKEEPFVIPVITRIEILRGRFDFMMKASGKKEWLRAQELLNMWDAILATYRVVPVSEVAALEFERLLTIKSLKKIGRGDIGIAAIALAHQATLVTRNLKDFKLVPGLKCENWAE